MWSARLAGALMAVALPARAAVLRVPSEHATIQTALSAAATGDTVLVAPGTYSGDGNRDLSFEGKDLVLRAAAGPALTVIDVAASADDAHRGIELSFVGAGAVVEGFSIRNGFMISPSGPTAPAASHDLSGAGIMIRNFASPLIRSCIIQNCHSEFTGGGIGIEFGATPRLEGCIVSGCTAGIMGGGVSVETGAAPVLVDCIFTGNRSRDGGGAHFSAGARVSGSLFAGNAASHRGGGVDVVYLARVELERSVVWNNCGPLGSEVFADSALAIPDSGELVFRCSALDTTGVFDRGRVARFEGGTVFSDPLFCAPAPCQNAPTTTGNYRLQAASPLLESVSPCGAHIGPLGTPCQVPVTPRSWTSVKSVYR